MPDDRGIFLTETWRMHPDVCDFISEQIYEGRLTTHESCELQSTEEGTSLRWLQVNHRGNQTESPEEAIQIADEVERLLGMGWTNQKGEEGRLARDDVMVVAPYNDQVRLIRGTLDDRTSTRGVRVGTVDKFQGQEAAVVLFSMATSPTRTCRAARSTSSRPTRSTWRSVAPVVWPIWCRPRTSSTAARGT
jgi:uncharacterized protein